MRLKIHNEFDGGQYLYLMGLSNDIAVIDAVKSDGALSSGSQPVQ